MRSNASLGALVAAAVLISLAPSALAQHALATNYLITGLAFNQCLQRGLQIMRQVGFEAQIMQPQGSTANTVGGTYGPHTGQILCLPNRVVVFVVTGPPDLVNEHIDTLKRAFVGQN